MKSDAVDTTRWRDIEVAMREGTKECTISGKIYDLRLK
jgi:hypothetical protein